ncbi:MAG: hypothetical protein GXP42_01725 [Chloroflexi bacterium]|nr:hypothetical protein [Chloroflexota bacterium]
MEPQYNKYKGLRLLGWLAQVLAWVTLLLSVVAALAMLFFMRDAWPGVRFAGRNLTGLLLLPMGLYFFVQLYIIGGVLMLLTDLEANTRRSATLFEQLLKQSQETTSALKRMSSRASMEMTPPPPPPPSTTPLMGDESEGVG